MKTIIISIMTHYAQILDYFNSLNKYQQIFVIAASILLPILFTLITYMFTKATSDIKTKIIKFIIWIILIPAFSCIYGFCVYLNLNKYVGFGIMLFFIAAIIFIPYKNEIKSTNTLFIFLMIFSSVLYFIQFADYFYVQFLENALKKFYIDSSGVLASENTSFEQGKLLSRLTNDTYRAFLPLTGTILSLFFATISIVVLNLIEVFRNRLLVEK